MWASRDSMQVQAHQDLMLVDELRFLITDMHQPTPPQPPIILLIPYRDVTAGKIKMRPCDGRQNLPTLGIGLRYLKVVAPVAPVDTSLP